MARGIGLFAFLFAVFGAGHAGDASDKELIEQLSELERILDKQQFQIQTLEAQRQHGRQLTAADPRTPSFYGGDSSNTTRAYTESEKTQGALTHMWVLLCGVLALFVQAGLVMIKMGFCRTKNVESIFLNHMTDILFGTLGWWIFGFTFAYDLEAYDGDGFKKNSGFAGGFGSAFGMGFIDVLGASNLEQQNPVFDKPNHAGHFTAGTPMLVWFFRWIFCVLAANIASSGVAERARQHSYMVYSICSSCFICPIVIAWTWGRGWVAGANGDVVYMDFAGSGIVHMVGGIAALVAAAICGPRTKSEGSDNGNNRGNADNAEGEAAGDQAAEQPGGAKPAYAFDPHSVPLIVLGTFTLWAGAYGLHCGSTLAMTSVEQGFLAAQVAMNTTLSAATGGLVAFILRFAIIRKYDVGFFCNGILGGIVAIAGSCGSVECGTAFAIGLVSALVLVGASMLVKKLGVDDPIDAFAVHGACGMWGVFAAGIFDWGKGFDHVHAWEGFRCIMNDEGDCKTGFGATLFGMNIALLLVAAAWVALFAIIIYGILKCLKVLTYDESILAKSIDREKFRPRRAYAYENAEVEFAEDSI